MRRIAVGIAAIAFVSVTAFASARQQPHPRINAAVKALTAARAELVAAPHDFGGHRADAIKAIDAAVVQLNLALKFADK